MRMKIDDILSNLNPNHQNKLISQKTNTTILDYNNIVSKCNILSFVFTGLIILFVGYINHNLI